MSIKDIEGGIRPKKGKEVLNFQLFADIYEWSYNVIVQRELPIKLKTTSEMQ